MIGFLNFPLIAPQVHGSNGVVWTKGFSGHNSRPLPSGLVLLIEDGFYSEGNRDLVRLTWFRREGARFKKVQAFQGMATLDDLPPKVQGDRVSLKTVDEPHVFLVSSADNTFGRDSTWRVQQGVPLLVSRKVLAPRLRVVDSAIWLSWTAKHPSPLQRQLRKAWPEQDDLVTWTEKRYGPIWTVRVNHEYLFTLRQAGSGKWNVVGFRTTHKAA